MAVKTQKIPSKLPRWSNSNQPACVGTPYCASTVPSSQADAAGSWESKVENEIISTVDKNPEAKEAAQIDHQRINLSLTRAIAAGTPKREAGNTRIRNTIPAVRSPRLNCGGPAACLLRKPQKNMKTVGTNIAHATDINAAALVFMRANDDE
jgi:hypothetical protein